MTKCGPNTCNELDSRYNLGLSENCALIITQRLIMISHWWPFWKKRSDLSHFETNDWDIPLQIHPNSTSNPQSLGWNHHFFSQTTIVWWSNHHCLMVKSPKSPLVDSQDRRATTAAFQRPRRHLARNTAFHCYGSREENSDVFQRCVRDMLPTMGKIW